MSASFRTSTQLEVLNRFNIPHGIFALDSMGVKQPIVHMEQGVRMIAAAVNRRWFSEVRGSELEGEMRKAGLLASLAEIRTKVKEFKLQPSAFTLTFEMCERCPKTQPPHGYIVTAAGQRRSYPIGTFADCFSICIGDVEAGAMNADLGAYLLRQMGLSAISLEEVTTTVKHQPDIRAMIMRMSQGTIIIGPLDITEL